MRIIKSAVVFSVFYTVSSFIGASILNAATPVTATTDTPNTTVTMTATSSPHIYTAFDELLKELPTQYDKVECIKQSLLTEEMKEKSFLFYKGFADLKSFFSVHEIIPDLKSLLAEQMVHFSEIIAPVSEQKFIVKFYCPMGTAEYFDFLKKY